MSAAAASPTVPAEGPSPSSCTSEVSDSGPRLLDSTTPTATQIAKPSTGSGALHDGQARCPRRSPGSAGGSRGGDLLFRLSHAHLARERRHLVEVPVDDVLSRCG